MAGLQILDLAIGVRVPASQPTHMKTAGADDDWPYGSFQTVNGRSLPK